jgi:hypothetical protein
VTIDAGLAGFVHRDHPATADALYDLVDAQGSAGEVGHDSLGLETGDLRLSNR